MEKKIIGLLSAFLFYLVGFGQVANYGDVGVIVNDNSPVSIEIGEYFRQSRNIPDQNIIHIQTVTEEAIDTTEFRNIQYQIKNYILNQGLENTLNYLVTTKGVPFDIQVDSCLLHPNFTLSKCSCVESELALLLSADSTKILKKSSIVNQYYGDTIHFNRTDYDILLVSRLDGYSKEDVFNLIDRSGPGSYVNKQEGQFIFDISYLMDTLVFNLLTGMMTPAIDSLNANGWNTLFHTDSLMPVNEEKVIGFVSIFQHIIQGDLNFTWEKGSFAELIVSGPEYTFYDSLNISGNILNADLIKEGVGSASGYVHPLFVSQLTDYTIFFTRYPATRNDPFNLAESYYMATKNLSWMSLLIGDPKTTITTEGGSLINESGRFLGFNVFPNPASDRVVITFSGKQNGRVTISIRDQFGKIVKQEIVQANSNRNEFIVKTENLRAGLYLIGISDESGNAEFKKLMIKQ